MATALESSNKDMTDSQVKNLHSSYDENEDSLQKKFSVSSELQNELSKQDNEKKKLGHRREFNGQVTYKKKATSELQEALQMGIGQSLHKVRPKRDLLIQDFSVIESVDFNREGSKETHRHEISDFRFLTHAPLAFRFFRELFGIKEDAFLCSLVREDLQEVSNPGASGSIFLVTHDDEFIIKTVQRKEADFLQKLLPGYYMNLSQNPKTLLPKFYGLYTYQCGNKNIRYVVMNNLLPTSIRMHEKYDLKGSTYKRKASKNEKLKKNPTYKDLDFMDFHKEGLLIEPGSYDPLMKTIEGDCMVLRSFKIMDYSLLLGIHYVDKGIEERAEAMKQNGENQPREDGVVRDRSVKRIGNFSMASECIQAKGIPIDIDDDKDLIGGIPARNTRGERLLLFMGIIDILQSYRLIKKMEHAFKSISTDGDTISVVRPGYYAQRFQLHIRNRLFQKVPSLDQPQIKGPHLRFRKLVHLALKQPQSRAKSLSKPRANTSESDAPKKESGVLGERPDLLSETSANDSKFENLTISTEASVNGSVTLNTNAHYTVTKDFKIQDNRISNINSGTDGLHNSVHSVAESTPTHTEYTEGTPSYTASSPSCSSERLDNISTSRVVNEDKKTLSTDQINIEYMNSNIVIPKEPKSIICKTSEWLEKSSPDENVGSSSKADESKIDNNDIVCS